MVTDNCERLCINSCIYTIEAINERSWSQRKGFYVSFVLGVTTGMWCMHHRLLHLLYSEENTLRTWNMYPTDLCCFFYLNIHVHPMTGVNLLSSFWISPIYLSKMLSSFFLKFNNKYYNFADPDTRCLYSVRLKTISLGRRVVQETCLMMGLHNPSKFNLRSGTALKEHCN